MIQQLRWKCLQYMDYILADCRWSWTTCVLDAALVALQSNCATASDLFFSFNCCGVQVSLALVFLAGTRGLSSLFSPWFLLFSCNTYVMYFSKKNTYVSVKSTNVFQSITIDNMEYYCNTEYYSTIINNNCVYAKLHLCKIIFAFNCFYYKLYLC